MLPCSPALPGCGGAGGCHLALCLTFFPRPPPEHELGPARKGQGSACFTRGTLLSLGGHRARGFLTGHGGVARGSAACISQFLDTSLAAPGQGRRPPVAASLPRRVCQGLELVHLQQALCLPPGHLRTPCWPWLPVLPVWPSLSHSSFHSLWLFHAPIPVCLLPWLSWVCPAQGRGSAQLQGAPFHRCSLSVGLFLTLSVLDCLLAPP